MLFATALTNESIADALAMPAYRPLYIALAREILAVAAARGVTPEAFDGFDPAAYLPDAPPGAAERSLDDLVAHNRRSAKTHSGIWRDLAVRKRPTEVDAQLGIVVDARRRGRRGDAAHRAARRADPRHRATATRPQSLETLDALAAAAARQDALHEPRLHRQDARSSPAPRTASVAPSRARSPSAARTVWACDVDRGRAARDRAAVRRGGGACTRVDVDVRDKSAVDALRRRGVGRDGPRGHPGEQRRRRARARWADHSRRSRRAEWQAIFDVNVSGAFYFSQAVAPGMKAARRGRIVNISSGAGLGISLTGIQAYASAKAAQIGLTRQLAHELGPWGITVNNIAPGFVRSNPTTERQWEVVRRGRAAGAHRPHRAQAAGHAGGHRATACCSSPRTTPAGSPARCSRSTVASEWRSTRCSRASRPATTRILGELIEFASIPSVSTDPAHATDVAAAAALGGATRLAGAGPFTVRTIADTAGNPVVYAEWLGAPGRADGARLRPLRRAAGGSAREVA